MVNFICYVGDENNIISDINSWSLSYALGKFYISYIFTNQDFFFIF